MKRSQTLVSVVSAIFMIAVGSLLFVQLKGSKKSTISAEKPEAPVRLVEVQRFESGNSSSLINIDGRVSAFEKINVSAEVTGRLLPAAKTFRAGSSFAKGDLLFKIDSEDERYSLYAQRSNLLNAITQMMPDLKFDYPESFEKWKQYLDAFNIESNTQLLPKPDSEQEKYYLANRNIYNLYYGIKSLEDRLANYNVYAPFSGVFLSVSGYPGALVSPGAALGQIMNTSRYELSAPVRMEDLQYISVGQKVVLRADELGESWMGTVSRISRQIDQATQSVPVYFSVSGRGLRDGVFVEGTLKGMAINDAVSIPRSLLTDQRYVWTMESGKAARKEIEVLSRTESELIVMGLSPEDQLIVSGVNNLFEGQELALTTAEQ